MPPLHLVNFTSLASRHSVLRGAEFHFRRFLNTTSEIKADCYVEHLKGSDEGIQVVAFARAPAKNALSKKMLTEFQEALETIRYDPNVRAVILKSTVPRVFCAGADLKERATMTQPQVNQFVGLLRDTFTRLELLPVPTIAALDGAALGGGFEIALACDLRVAGPGAKIGLPETRLAIIPGAGGTQRLPRIVGRAKAKELIFTGKVLGPEEALQYGLVNAISNQEEGGYQRALEMAREILPAGPVAIRAAKMAIDRGSEVDVTSGMTMEQLCYAMTIPTKDRLEGLKAFAEKRKPVYRNE